jgi:DNA repair exonuclease SbcCD ATPase subunit
MTEFIRVFPAAAPALGDLLAKNFNWPQADEVAKRLQAMLPPQMQGNDPRIQQAQQAMQQMQQAIQQLQQQLQAAQGDTAIQQRKLAVDEFKAKVDAYKAETDRMSAVAPAMGPVEIQALVMQTLHQVMSSPDVLPAQQPALMPN